MKPEEIIAKLGQIEEQAASTLAEYPHGLTVERVRLILGLARQLRSHLRDEIDQRRRQSLAIANDTQANDAAA